MAARKDFTSDQGATFSRMLVLRDSAGAAVDLTGFTAKMQVRETYGAAAALLDLTTENGGIVLGGVDGTITITATPAQTGGITVPDVGGIPPSLYAVYDFVLTAPDGSVRRRLYGQFVVTRRVSE